ncbi:MAG: hypothetical protein JEZ09_02975 [Salinivirgaceae bacterium]|nr:hypothetical protein [Salinivirgaceae bacterium]
MKNFVKRSIILFVGYTFGFAVLASLDYEMVNIWQLFEIENLAFILISSLVLTLVTLFFIKIALLIKHKIEA